MEDFLVNLLTIKHLC